MAFTFEVQDPDNPTSTANAYLSVADFKDYADGRGYDYSGVTDDQIKQAIVQATDYMDVRFAYAGFKELESQSTEVPRRDVYDAEGNVIDNFPRLFLNACAEYTKIVVLDGLSLMPNAQDNTIASVVTLRREKADVVEREFEYDSNKGYQYPRWPLPDSMLQRSGLLGSQTRRTIGRG